MCKKTTFIQIIILRKMIEHSIIISIKHIFYHIMKENEYVGRNFTRVFRYDRRFSN